MTFAELVVAVHDWTRRLPLAKVRAAIQRQLESEEGVEGFHRGISIDAVLVMVRMGLGPGMRLVVFGLRGEAPAAPRRDEPSETAIASESASKPEAEPEAAERAPRREWRRRPSKRAQALVREQLANGPKAEAEIEAAAQAAEIPKPSLIAAADALGVRTRRGQWWLPGVAPNARADRDNTVDTSTRPY
jgi:hypothetical protein